jgi:ketosteroid isomerase-like protein
MRDVYTCDAVFEVPAMDVSCHGIDNIIAFFTQSRAGFASARHVIDNVVVEGDGDSAKSSA